VSDKPNLKELAAYLDKHPFKFHDMGKSTAHLMDEDDPGSSVVIRDEKGRDRIFMSQEDYWAARDFKEET